MSASPSVLGAPAARPTGEASHAGPGRAARPSVLHVVLSLTPGGTEYLVVEMCRRLAPAFDVAVCCLDGEGEWAPRVRQAGGEVVALERRPGFHPGLGLQIARMAARRGARLLHCHHYSPFVYGRIAQLVGRNLQVIYTEHGRLSDAPPSRKRRLVNPWLSRFDGAMFAVSHDLRAYMLASRLPADRVDVIHNGITPGVVPSAADRRRARRLLGVDDDQVVAMTVARLDPVKQLDGLLDALAIARRGRPRLRLVVVGDGPERAALEARAARADLAGAVVFAGYRADVAAALAAADLYVNSSTSEGISITILEAMAAGLPVVATAVGGTPEIVSEATGVLVPPRDAARLASAILDLAGSPARRATLGAAGRRRLEAHFTIERMVDEYVGAYRRLLG